MLNFFYSNFPLSSRQRACKQWKWTEGTMQREQHKQKVNVAREASFMHRTAILYFARNTPNQIIIYPKYPKYPRYSGISAIWKCTSNIYQAPIFHKCLRAFIGRNRVCRASTEFEHTCKWYKTFINYSIWSITLKSYRKKKKIKNIFVFCVQYIKLHENNHETLYLLIANIHLLIT